MKEKLKHLPEWGLEVEPDNIPDKLKASHRWVVWSALQNKAGRVLKHPCQLNGRIAQTNNPKHRYSFEDALVAYQTKNFNGIGFVLTGLKKPITVLDLDKARGKQGVFHDWAKRILDAAQSYTEISPSGNGLRVFLVGDAGEFIRAKLGVECYTQDSGRYLTVTGHHVAGLPKEIGPVTPELMEILDEYRPDPSEEKQGKGPVTGLSDKELHEILREVPHDKYEGYDEWLRLGMAIHHQWSGDPDAMELWDELSQHTASYDRGELESKWDSFGLGGAKQVTLASWLPRHDHEPVAWEDFPDLGDEGEDQAEQGSDVEGVGGDAYAELGMQSGNQAVDEKVPEEILEDWLAKKEVSGWAGQPGAMKTMSLLGLAMEMAKEHEEYGEWMGQMVKPGVVVWFAYEGVGAIRKRLRAYRTLEEVPARLVIVTPKYHLLDKEWTEYVKNVVLAAQAREGSRPQLVVIDTLAAATPGMKEKDEEDMGKVARRMRKVAEGAQAHVAFVHHSTKDGSSDLRGSGLLTGDVDTIVRMESREGKEEGVDIEVRKQRNLGSIGQARRGVKRTINTGLETSFGKDETAPILEQVVLVDKTGSPEAMDLSDRVQNELMDSQETLLQGNQVVNVREGWLTEHYPTASKPTATRRWVEACEELKGMGYEVKKGARGVNLIRPFNRGQSQGFDEEEGNWGEF